MTQPSNRSLPILISVFFFWGFVAASNDILIPVFKEKLNLEQWQSQMISFAFYIAYTVGSIIYYLLLSKANGSDILNRIGYVRTLCIALGLIISCVGNIVVLSCSADIVFCIDDKRIVYCRAWVFASANGGESACHQYRQSEKRFAEIKFGGRNK